MSPPPLGSSRRSARLAFVARCRRWLSHLLCDTEAQESLHDLLARTGDGAGGTSTGRSRIVSRATGTEHRSLTDRRADRDRNRNRRGNKLSPLHPEDRYFRNTLEPAVCAYVMCWRLTCPTRPLLFIQMPPELTPANISPFRETTIAPTVPCC